MTPSIIMFICVLLLSASHIRANIKIAQLEMLLDGVVKFGPEKFDKMLKKGPPPQ